MRFTTTPKSCSPIGIDFGHRYIKAVQLGGVPDKPVLTATASIERCEPGTTWTLADAQRLKAVLDRRGFEGREVVTAVPTAQCLTGVLSLPPVESGAPVREIAATEMAHMHRCEADAIEIALWDVPQPARAAEGRAVMAAGCRHDEAEVLVTHLEDAGLDVCALDIEGWALVRACGARALRSGQATAILDLGWESANLVLVHGTTLIYKRLLSGAGLSSLAEPVQRTHRFELEVIDHLLVNVGLDDQTLNDGDDAQLAGHVRGSLESHFEQVAQELSLSLSYAAHQYPDAPVEQLLLTGGGARILGLSAWLSACLEIAVEVVTPQSRCEVPASLGSDGDAPELDIAMGLALHREQEMS